MSRGRPNFHQREMQSPKRRKKRQRKEPKAKRTEGGFHLAAVEFRLEKEKQEKEKGADAAPAKPPGMCLTQMRSLKSCT